MFYASQFVLTCGDLAQLLHPGQVEAAFFLPECHVTELFLQICHHILDPSVLMDFQSSVVFLGIKTSPNHTQLRRIWVRIKGSSDIRADKTGYQVVAHNLARVINHWFA